MSNGRRGEGRAMVGFWFKRVFFYCVIIFCENLDSVYFLEFKRGLKMLFILMYCITNLYDRKEFFKIFIVDFFMDMKFMVVYKKC